MSASAMLMVATRLAGAQPGAATTGAASAPAPAESRGSFPLLPPQQSVPPPAPPPPAPEPSPPPYTGPPPPQEPAPSFPAPSPPMSVVRELGPAAAPPAAPPEEDPEYGWNFGAGVTAGGTVAGFDGFPGTPGVMEGTGYFRPPIYLLSFERRTWASGWFFFGGAAGYVTSDVGSSDGSNSTRRLAVTDVGGLIGIRQVIVSKIVDVSIWAGFGLGYRFVSGDAVPSGASTYWARPGSNAMTLGPRAGLAFERELLQALAVRISAQLVSFDYSRSETVLEGSTNEESSLAFAVGVVPALQLRLYF